MSAPTVDQNAFDKVVDWAAADAKFRDESLRWYSFERYLPYADAILSVGFLLVVVAVAHWNGWAALALFGGGLVVLAVMMGKA